MDDESDYCENENTLNNIVSNISLSSIEQKVKCQRNSLNESVRRNSLYSSGSNSSNEGKAVLMIRLADVQHRLYLAESHVRLYMATTKINKVFFNFT